MPSGNRLRPVKSAGKVKPKSAASNPGATDAEQQRMYELFMQAPAAIGVVRGQNHVFEFTNPLYGRLVGKKENLIGRSVREAFPELEGQGFFELLDNVYKTGEPYVGNEMPIKWDVHGDGSLVENYLNFVYQPFKNRAGQVQGIMAHAVDVTDQVRARQKAEESEGHFRSSFEQAAVGMAHLALDGRWLRVNQRLCDLLGYTKQEMQAQSFQNLTHPDDLAASVEAVQSLKSGQVSTHSFEKRYLKKDGSAVWVNLTISPALDRDGSPKYFISVIEDITKRKRAEGALRASEVRWRFMAESLPQKIFTATRSGEVDYFNQQWTEFTGLSFQQIKDWGWTQFIHPEDVDENIRRWRYSIDTGEPFQFEHRFRRHDGVYSWHLSRAQAMRDEGGNIVMWVGSNTEIDEQKKLMEQKDEFIGIASHELKTPVTSIKAFAQILQRRLDRDGNSELQGYVHKMDGQITKLTNLINDLLDVTKIESGKLVFHPVKFDFDTMVRELVEDLQLTTDKHRITIEGSVKKLVTGDRDRIGQVLINLISNAIKYSPHADKIIISQAGDSRSVTVCVRDFGVGVSREKQERVFERFFRVSGPKRETFPGLGLGLYISAEIVKRQGGRIWVESSGQQGSTFCFTLPTKPAKTAQPRRSPNARLVMQHE